MWPRLESRKIPARWSWCSWKKWLVWSTQGKEIKATACSRLTWLVCLRASPGANCLQLVLRAFLCKMVLYCIGTWFPNLGAGIRTFKRENIVPQIYKFRNPWHKVKWVYQPIIAFAPEANWIFGEKCIKCAGFHIYRGVHKSTNHICTWSRLNKYQIYCRFWWTR